MVNRFNTVTQCSLALSVGVGLYELARSSVFIYSFRFEPAHVTGLLWYPLLFAGLPFALSRVALRGKGLSTISLITWLSVMACALVPFVYERLLFASHPARVSVALIAPLALSVALWWGWRSERLTLTRVTLMCATLYCVAIDSGLELSKALLNLIAGRGLSLKVLVAWLGLYAGLTLWLTLHQRWSAHPKRLASLILLSALGHASLYSYQPPAPPHISATIKDPPRPHQRSTAPYPDIYLLIFDAMRGDARSFVRTVEGDESRLEAFESLAARSLDFRDAHSGSLATYESIPRLLELNGPQPFLRLWPLKNYTRWSESLPGRLSRLGYETHLLTDYPNAVLKGFDAVDWGGVSSLQSRHLRLLNLWGDLKASLTGARATLKARRGATMASVTEPSLIEQLAQVLTQPKVAPRFVVLHFATPHQPYAFPPYHPPSLPAEFDPERANEDFLGAFSDASPQEIERFKRHYARALHGADHTLSKVTSLLKRHGDEARDLLIVTSDHGELFGDHGVTRLAHGGHFYQASHHVPLLISGAGLKPEQITEPVSHTRLASTLYQLLGVEPHNPTSLTERKGTDEAGFELRYARRGGVAQRGRWRLIWSAHPRWLKRADWAHRAPLELYDIARDPGERENLAERSPEVVDALVEHFKLPLPLKP